jgi:hypothetical protein
MPRYHLHVCDQEKVIHDLEGQELPDLAAAVEEAILAARELMVHQLRRGMPLDLRCTILIQEEGSATSTSLSFPVALSTDATKLTRNAPASELGSR